MSICILSSSNEENKNVHSVEKESLEQYISAILYFKQIEKMDSCDYLAFSPCGIQYASD
jgi:hypothetical protein